jgi:Ca-activated chloride channel homolog
MIRRWLRSTRTRRGLALGIVVLATGGLVLARAPAISSSMAFGVASGDHATTFSGPGARGTLALSQTKVLASSGQTVFAELRLEADPAPAVDEKRAPLALAIVLDTSGSMSGEKIENAKRSVVSLLRQMRDDDEVALIRYDSSQEVVQSLARLGTVRSSLVDRVQSFTAGGGTNIPSALDQAITALSDASTSRVRRVVLVSDGLDGGRVQSVGLARNALDARTTVSALGIGLDFDEGYMSAVADAGRGNFGFVENPGALSQFLKRELEETAHTVVESAHARLQLRSGARFVRAVGAQANVRVGEVDLVLGSLFAGDRRRVVVELAIDAEHGEKVPISAEVSWARVGGDRTEAKLAELSVTGERDAETVFASRDGRVYASALSATASLRQIAASEAYARGDQAAAQALMQQNSADLERAAAMAPPEEKPRIARQQAEVQLTRSKFEKLPAASPAAKAASKESAMKNSANLSRTGF